MPAWVQRHRRFLIFSLSTFLMLGVLAGLFALLGERVVRTAYEGRSTEFLNEYFAPRGVRTLARVQERAHGAYHSALLLVIALWTLSAVLYALIRRGRLRWLPVGVLGWWLAVETFVAPNLDFPLWVVLHELVQDPDHRPTYTTGQYNSDGMRGTLESSEFLPEGLNLVFLGDSFALGPNVKPEQAFPHVAGALLTERHPQARIRVANFGWTSSSPLLSLRRIVDVGERYSPDIVLMCLDMTDFEDDLRYGHMIARDGLYALYDKLPLSLRAFQKLAPKSFKRLLAWSVGGMPERRFFVTDAPIAETQKWMEPCLRNIERIHAWCAAREVDFVLVVLPRSYQYSDREVPRNWESEEYVPLGGFAHEPFRFFNRYAERVPFPVVSLLEDFEKTDVFPTCFENDPHWNPAGHRVAAEAIAREIEAIVVKRLN